MIPKATGSPLEDVEYLARSDHRVAALEALAERPQSRADLRALTGASASTIGRTLRAFDERNWVSRDGPQYEATPLGAFVASGMRALLDRIETEQRLRSVWRDLSPEADAFPVEFLDGATVTVAAAENPYRPVNRFASLLRETERFRFVGTDLALLEPCKDDLRRRIVDGMEAEIIDPPHVARYVLSTYPEHCAEPLESGRLTVMLHDDLPPYGVSLFDERIAVSYYDRNSGTVRALIDTAAPDARDWAEAIFERYRRTARPLALEASV